MLKLNEIKPAVGSRKKKHRVGRGSGSGWGSTSGRGNNGAKQRSGYSQKDYFEGGQLPLIRRLPKRGFTSVFKKYFQIVNITDINELAKTADCIDASVLYAAGKIYTLSDPIKVLGDGTLEKSVTVKAHAFSKSAEEKILAVQGKIEVVSRA